MDWLNSIRTFLQDRLQQPARTAELEAGRVVAALDAPPADPIPDAIAGEPELRAAFAWLAWLQSRADTLAATHRQIVQLVEQTYARELDLPANQTTIPELAGRLESLLQQHAKDHPELFEGGATHRRPYGSIKRTAGKLRIELDGEKADVEQHLRDRLKLSEALAAVHQGDAEAETLLELARIKIEPNLQHAQEAYKAGTLTAEQLALAKLKPATGEATFKIELPAA